MRRIVPEIEFLLLCDYARGNGGLIDIIGGGVDQIRSPKLPTVHALGLAGRLRFEKDDIDREHAMSIVFKDPTGEPLTQVRGIFFAQSPTGFLALNITVPLQSYGVHTLEFTIDDVVLGTRDVTVMTPPEA
jgi:hypothetical protein